MTEGGIIVVNRLCEEFIQRSREEKKHDYKGQHLTGKNTFLLLNPFCFENASQYEFRNFPHVCVVLMEASPNLECQSKPNSPSMVS